ncbi:VAMP-associated protein [Pleurotus eryngii]|uniref:VAMP-associated protein n=1 Tax=Pleurotus eryngii TaxID=5323 RepID=A0A9P6A8A1_PLEER|nr:VAMP-associated protein [Pleurotus eryngii]
MSVSLNPSSSLGFKRPFDNVVKQSLRISNHNTLPVAFKVKTTAPKHYCVRPNSGRVEPGETVEVAVMLQAMKDEPPLSVKCKDKFLIQSTAITPEKASLPLQEIWNGEGGEEAKVHQQKLRVVYLPPEGQIEEEEEEAGQPIKPRLAESHYATVPHPNGEVHPPIPEFPKPDPAAEPGPVAFKPTPPSHQESRAPTPPVEPEYQPAPLAFSPSPVTVPRTLPEPVAPVSPIPTPAPAPVESPLNIELQIKFEEAQAEIERLRNLLTAASVAAPTEQTEIRHRRRSYSDAGSDSGSTAIGTYIDDGYVPQDGVPLQVVVIIALGVFVTTYLFF